MKTGEAVSQKNKIMAEERIAADPDTKISVTAKASKSAAKKHRRKVIGIIIAIPVIIAIAIPFIQLRIRCVQYYNQGIAYMINGEYAEAFPYFGYVYAKSPYYKHVHELTDYTYAGTHYSETDYQSMTSCISALNRIPADYSGPFADEIRDFRVQAEAAYLPLEAEEQKRLASIEAERQKRLAEEEAERERERKAAEAERERKFQEKLRTSNPWVGMDEKYIDQTALGEHSKCAANHEYHNYYWSGYYAQVEVKTGKVVEVSATNYKPPKKSSSSKSGSGHSVTFEGNNYADAEDFYYWERDNFVDFEEAEDYFYSH